MNPKVGLSAEDRYAIAFQKGDEKGLAFFFQKYYPALCLYASYYTRNDDAAKDIASVAFINTWKHHSKFLSAISIRAYLYTVVRRLAIGWVQKETRLILKQKNVAVHTNNNAVQADHLANLIKAETYRRLNDSIDTLPPKCRDILKMLYIDGMTVAEVAEALRLSPSTIKTQKKRGIEALRKKYLFAYRLLIQLHRIAITSKINRRINPWFINRLLGMKA